MSARLLPQLVLPDSLCRTPLLLLLLFLQPLLLLGLSQLIS